MACDDEVIPLQERIETVADDADLEDVYNTERHLLYVACTRARDHLLVTGVKPASEFWTISRRRGAMSGTSWSCRSHQFALPPLSESCSVPWKLSPSARRVG